MPCLSRLKSAFAIAAAAAMLPVLAWAGAIPALEGTEWGPENGLGQYIQFKPDNQVFGFAGCNSFIGQYTQTGDKLSLSDITTTKALCSGMMGAEAAFLDGLKGAHRIDIVNGDIRVYNADDRWILGLRQRR